MIVVLGDTHGEDDHRLTGHMLTAIREADLVIHTGDFYTETVLDAFRAESNRLCAVYGNNDVAGVRDRLPARQVFEAAESRFVLVHGHEHSETALSLLGRQERADLVIFGHSHRPGVSRYENGFLLNPGSYAEPRQFRPAYVELDSVESGHGIRGRLCEPSGAVFEEFLLHPGNGSLDDR